MSNADRFERHMLDLINAERAKVGAPPLRLEQNLNASAEAHSLWMLRTDTFSHTGVGDSSATERMRDAGFDFSGSWRSAENIAIQSERGPDGILDDVENLHVSLMNSSGHRANILNPALEYIGIGVELGDFNYSSGRFESVIVTQNFAATNGSVDLDQSASAPTPSPLPPADPPADQPVVPTEDPVDGPPAMIEGAPGADTLVGTADDERLIGGGGDDRLNGRAGDDTLEGGAGDDVIFGRRGEDLLLGGGGDDRLAGGQNADLLLGGRADDNLRGGAGSDTLNGGVGDDKLKGGQGADVFVFARGGDRDEIRDFRSDVDEIDLTDFGGTGVRQAFSSSEQRGADLILDFGDGDVLTLLDVTLIELFNDVIF